LRPPRRKGQIGAVAESAPAPAAPLPLPRAPSRIVELGSPVFGAWAGSVPDASFDGLNEEYPRGMVARRLTEKRWVYVLVPTREVMLAMALVDAGYLSSGFCAVLDRGSGKLLFDSSPVLPPLCASIGEVPGDGLSARLVGPRIKARIERSGGRILVEARWMSAAVDVVLDARAAPPPLSVCSRIGTGRFNFTQKLVCVPAEGEIRAGNARFTVHGDLAGMDFTHGFPARETKWRWAFGSGKAGARTIGFNLSEGFLPGSPESAAWVDGPPCATGPVRFEGDFSDRDAPWRIRGEDGGLDLVFTPEGRRAQDIDLKLVASRYLQPFGTFRGHLTAASGERIAIEAIPGVTEEHVARW
jgi:hypothetical protein